MPFEITLLRLRLACDILPSSQLSLIVVRVGLGTSHETTTTLPMSTLHSTKPSQPNENTAVIQCSTGTIGTQDDDSTQHISEMESEAYNQVKQVEKVALIMTDTT
ncbi:hypothetical protein OBBRIDRAFT_213989 [Obba rivulosa]|uniref:Uncharacterized protein n=1 Tax=Obba rivulosa TaxID=1052685 RepID=A0A8E2AL68_9APHY|nr:hypothetical protein OBBRIDRAFT_213989 [Obba rivulosa]